MDLSGELRNLIYDYYYTGVEAAKDEDEDLRKVVSPYLALAQTNRAVRFEARPILYKGYLVHDSLERLEVGPPLPNRLEENVDRTNNRIKSFCTLVALYDPSMSVTFSYHRELRICIILEAMIIAKQMMASVVPRPPQIVIKDVGDDLYRYLTAIEPDASTFTFDATIGAGVSVTFTNRSVILKGPLAQLDWNRSKLELP